MCGGRERDERMLFRLCVERVREEGRMALRLCAEREGERRRDGA